MKITIMTVTGVIGSICSFLFGGWSAGMTTLESRAGFKGLCRKGTVLLIVLIAHRLDLALGTHFIKDGVITAYILNDAVSIIENVGLMGLPMPQVLKKAIDMLKEETEE